MTSGVFHVVALDDIIVKRDERQRRELSNIENLADSINRVGLIHPLVITRDMELVAGERRLSAIKSLGWTSVPVQYTDEVEASVLEAIELEENIKRQDISWQDQVRAVAKYHEIRGANVPNWTQLDTATAIGLSKAHVNNLLMVASELARPEATIGELPKLSTATGVVRRAQERRDVQVLERLHSAVGTTSIPPPPESILNVDFHDWMEKGAPHPLFNFIHCDFPYGIDADEFVQGASGAHGGYADTKETWQALIESLDQCTQSHTTQQCHLMFWFAMRKGSLRLYEPTVEALETMGWTINPIPLIWVKSDGAGIIPDPERGPRQVYETCLLGSRGDRKIVRAVANAYSAPTVRERHMSEKPEPMLRHFFGMLVDENTIMLDPTCGSGSALRAAESLGAKYVLGLERDIEFTERARAALKQFRALRRAG